jgi:hypothetical protein
MLLVDGNRPGLSDYLEFIYGWVLAIFSQLESGYKEFPSGGPEQVDELP